MPIQDGVAWSYNNDEWRVEEDIVTQTINYINIRSGTMYCHNKETGQMTRIVTPYERGLSSGPPQEPDWPDNRSPESMMRIITKLSLLWEKESHRDFTQLINTLCYRGGRSYGQLEDGGLEREIDLMLKSDSKS